MMDSKPFNFDATKPLSHNLGHYEEAAADQFGLGNQFLEKRTGHDNNDHLNARE
jgi:hypothetical protein